MSDAMKEPHPDPGAKATSDGTRTVGPAVLVSSVHSGEVGCDDRGGTTAGSRPVVTGLRAVAKGSFDRILLVEDNLVNQQTTVAMLEKLGFCVDVVDNGVEAVTVATLIPYRAILMDCQIPTLNGYDTTIEIRSQEGASRNTPIIAVTGSVSEPDRKRCMTAGMDGFLAKPLSLQTLAEGMARWAPDPSGFTGSLNPMPPLATTTTGRPPRPELEVPALDAEVIERLERLGRATGEDLLGQVATLFLEDADTRVITLRDALAREDGPALIQSAHTMCGASANLGAAELARLCARLATDGPVGDPESGQELLQAVELELARVCSALGATRASCMPAENLVPPNTPSPASAP
jgi:two-component system sensor histidine kinase/response regulator